ncbi:MAG: tetratricopeptide repeat protein [Cystobacterineae bacterium]|nr:tetratricopeptide repeat protein [Cystobacterineae bacterium]
MRRSLSCVVVLLTGCFFPAERGHLLEVHVQKLRMENESLGLEVKENQERTAKALGQTEQWARQSGADIGVQMQRSIEEIASLRGELGLLEHRLRELEAAQAALRIQMQSVPAVPPTEAISPAAAPPSTSPPAIPPKPKPDEPKAFLKYAQEALAAKDMEGAQALLNEFLRRWPKDSAAGEVYFQLGETHFVKQHYREALYEYGKVIQEFPKTTSAPLTYLRSSECFRQLKKLAESKLALEELIRVHPKSAEAKKAADLLKSLEEAEKKAKEKKGK